MKKLLAVVLFTACTALAFSQEKPRLAILPFTGGTDGDGETIAQIFSIQQEILEAFTVVPRTNAVNALIAEQNFQLSGYTDSDTIAGLGKMLNADFVVSGHIRRLGNSNLIIATIVNVESFEQMAGDYRLYRNIEDIPDLLPAISGKMITASKRDTSRLPKLAVAPFSIANTGVNVQDAETLAQILAIEISNTGKYAVLPRTATMQAALRELDYQMSGYTAEEGAKALGRAINAEYVLSADSRSLGSVNMFIAQILHAEDGSLLAGDRREYRIVDDGISLMEELSLYLTGTSEQISRWQQEQQKRDADKAHYWTVGVSLGSSFVTPWLIGTIHATIAPFRKSFLEIGFDFGIISGVEDVGYYSMYPYAHYAVFLPFEKKGGWYIGAGGGYMIAELDYPEGKVPKNTPLAGFTTGFNIGNVVDLSYTLRTNFSTMDNKVSVGYTYRFK